jgi:S1-C subfamily serine protease
VITSQCYERTLQLNVPSGFGTGFTITRHDRQWLVTAQHVIDGIDESEIVVLRRGTPVEVQLKSIPRVRVEADVAVFELDREITPELPLFPTSDGAVYTQDVYFLGFPFGLGLGTAGVAQLPFVKKAIISASDDKANGVKIWYLDGINNPGFSGGPVVFRRQGTSDWHVLAVVQGYLPEKSDLIGGGPGSVSTNSGIIFAFDIRHGIEAIDTFVGT